MSEAAVLGCFREISGDFRGDFWYKKDELATAAQLPESVLEKATSHRFGWVGWQSLAMEPLPLSPFSKTMNHETLEPMRLNTEQGQGPASS